MRTLSTPAALACLALLIVAATVSTLVGQGQAPAPAPARPAPAPAAPQAGHPSGKLVIWGDVGLFEQGPNDCLLTNRYKRGQRVGFRMTAVDGGSGEVENTAVLVAHVTLGGNTIDVPMRWRGAAGPSGAIPRNYLRVPLELWTGIWTVPADAPIGTISYTVTATDRFGRTATFTPFPYLTSQLAIVE
jgi:hypothetical protein